MQVYAGRGHPFADEKSTRLHAIAASLDADDGTLRFGSDASLGDVVRAVFLKVVVASKRDQAACLSVTSSALRRALTQTRLGGFQLRVDRDPQRSGCFAFAAS